MLDWAAYWCDYSAIKKFMICPSLYTKFIGCPVQQDFLDFIQIEFYNTAKSWHSVLLVNLNFSFGVNLQSWSHHIGGIHFGQCEWLSMQEYCWAQVPMLLNLHSTYALVNVWPCCLDARTRCECQLWEWSRGPANSSDLSEWAFSSKQIYRC